MCHTYDKNEKVRQTLRRSKLRMTTEKQTKKHVSVVIVGHVDAGKSTTTGRLLVELGNFSKRDLEKLKQEANELGKESFFYAFVTVSSHNSRSIKINKYYNI